MFFPFNAQSIARADSNNPALTAEPLVQNFVDPPGPQLLAQETARAYPVGAYLAQYLLASERDAAALRMLSAALLRAAGRSATRIKA